MVHEKINTADVIVLGATGMFGHVAARTMQQQYGVVATARRVLPGHVPFEIGDSDDGLIAVLRQAKPGALVVNAIALTASQMKTGTDESASSVNAVFPHRLSRIAAQREQRIVHISTDAVFAPDCGEVYEDSPISPRDDYGKSKAAGEVNGAHCVTIRCTIVGPPSPGRRSGLWAWVTSQERGATISGYTDQLWSGLTTQQLAQVCLALVDRDRFAAVRSGGALHHLAPNPVISKFELVRELADMLRPDMTVRPVQSRQPVNRILTSRNRLLDPLTPHWPSWRATLAAAANDN